MGYFNDPEKTAAAFAGGWFHSGDLGVRGRRGLHQGGRSQEGHDQDRRRERGQPRGRRVPVPAAPGVSEVAVIGLPHPRWIEAVTAVVVLKAGHSARPRTQVIAHCDGQLAHFKTPKGVVFVDALPKNPSGKLLKRELRLRFEAHYGHTG
ncbi:MAG: hypothetical protein U5L74_02575 [Ideonella sp.]|nr:hypothetical protein [Ideonella sp.]